MRAGGKMDGSSRVEEVLGFDVDDRTTRDSVRRSAAGFGADVEADGSAADNDRTSEAGAGVGAGGSSSIFSSDSLDQSSSVSIGSSSSSVSLPSAKCLEPGLSCAFLLLNLLGAGDGLRGVEGAGVGAGAGAGAARRGGVGGLFWSTKGGVGVPAAVSTRLLACATSRSPASRASFGDGVREVGVEDEEAEDGGVSGAVQQKSTPSASVGSS